MQAGGEQDFHAHASQQVAALPWRLANTPEIMIISSRGTGRWVLPKGWPMKGKTLAEAAAREALEEAGLVGEIDEDAFGSYAYVKRAKNGASRLCRVSVFPMRIRRQRKDWPEKRQRVTRWVPVEVAANSVDEPELRDLILGFGASLLASQMEASAP